MIVNLILNAVDAVEGQSKKWIRVSIFDDDSRVVMQFTDSGRGIPESIRNKLFDPFFTTKAIGKGTGLGLSITKGILDQHKATISLLSNEPNTCFEIRFPKV